MRIDGAQSVVAMLELQREAGRRQTQLVESVVPLGRVERQAAVAQLSVGRVVLTLSTLN